MKYVENSVDKINLTWKSKNILSLFLQLYNLYKRHYVFEHIKEKLTADQVATIFVNGICDVINRGFEPVVDCINDDPSFVKSPEIVKTTSMNLP